MAFQLQALARVLVQLYLFQQAILIVFAAHGAPQVDALQDHRQLARSDLGPVRTGSNGGNLERALFEAFEQDHCHWGLQSTVIGELWTPTLHRRSALHLCTIRCTAD